MPNFKEFIKGFEEKPEAKNPNPAPTPKPQEVKMEQPKPSKDPMPFGMKRRMEDEVSVHNGQQPKGGQQMPKKDYSYLDDRELYAQINLAENEEEYQDLLAEKERRWQESQKNKPEPKEGSFEKMMQGFEQPKEEPKAEEPKEDIYTINPQWANVEYDEDYERSYGEGANADDIEFEMSENPEIYEGKTRHQIVAALSNRLNTHPDKIRELLGKPKQEAKPREGSFQQAFGEETKKEEFKPNPKADDLIKRYYAHEFDLGQLHDQLIKVFGSIKPAFEYLLKRTRR